MHLWLHSAGSSSSSCVSAVVKRLRIPVLSLCCCSSLWTEVFPGDSCRNFSSATTVIKLVWWPWRSHCVLVHHLLECAGGSPPKMDTFTARGLLIRYIKWQSIHRYKESVSFLEHLSCYQSISLSFFNPTNKSHGNFVSALPFVGALSQMLFFYSIGGGGWQC